MIIKRDCSNCRMDAVKCSNFICGECFMFGDSFYPMARDRWQPKDERGRETREYETSN